MSKNKANKVEQKNKGFTYQYIPDQEKKLLDMLSSVCKQTKVSVLREALLLYSDWIQEKTIPSFKMMKAYLKDARETNEILKDEIHSLKGQIETVRQSQSDLIKGVNKWITKR